MKAYPKPSRLKSLIAEYTLARNEAERLVRENERAAESANAPWSRASGISYQTPFIVIDSVTAWKKAAIRLAEHMVEIHSSKERGEL